MPKEEYLTRDRSYDVRLIIWCNSDLFDESGKCNYEEILNTLKRSNKQNIAIVCNCNPETKISDVFLDLYCSVDPLIAIEKIHQDYLIDTHKTAIVIDDVGDLRFNNYNVETPKTVIKYAHHNNFYKKIVDSPRVKEYKRNKNNMSLNEAILLLNSIVEEEHNLWATYELLHILRENNTEPNLKKAYELCLKYSEYNNDLKYKLAKMYKMGEGTKTDFKKYMDTLHGAMIDGSEKAKYEWVKSVIDKRLSEHYQEILKICSTDDPQSKGFLGRMYRLGLGVEKDLDKSIELIKYSSDNNIAWARNEYTDALLERGKTEDLKIAFENTKKFSEEGNAWAKARLARMYRDGIFVERDIDTAIQLMQSASEMGVIWAKKELMEMLEKNEDKIGIPSDMLNALKNNVPLAFSQLLKINNSNHDEAQKILESIELLQKRIDSPSVEAHMLYYKLKTSDKEDRDDIISELSKASIKGNKDASAILAEMYHSGTYVESDLDYSILYGRLSLRNDTGREVNELIDKLLKRGTNADKKEAFELCKKSSDLGDAWSTGRLARMYKNGTFVTIDLKKAKELYAIAANKGVSWAEKELKSITDQ